MCRSTPTTPPTGSPISWKIRSALLAVTHQRFADRFPAKRSRRRARPRALPRSPRSPRRRCTTRSAAPAPSRSATCSTPPARPGGRRASRSRIPRSAISSASPPRATASASATASIRACRSPSTSPSRSFGFRSSPARRWSPTPPPTACSARSWRSFSKPRAVTCFCCVPTLLASIERDLPKLRVLLIGGEACPPALVKRWSRPGRALLNSYGPTEATVTATLGRMTPDRPVTIGRPLPTYSIVILDAERAEALPLGESGEIGIAGIGVAEGYLNRPGTDRRPSSSPISSRIPNNPSGRIYRTGDLGRINERGRDRISRPHRHAGEAARLSHRADRDRIGAARSRRHLAGRRWRPSSRSPARRSLSPITRSSTAPRRPTPADILAHLRARLPAYMTPAYLERLPFIPMLVSNKADRAQLPKPKSPPIRVSASTPSRRPRWSGCCARR